MYTHQESNTDLTTTHEKLFMPTSILTIRPPGRYKPVKLIQYDRLEGFMCALFLFWESQCGGELGQLRDPPIHNPKGRPSTTRLGGPSEGPAQPVNRRVECKHLPPVRTQLFNTSPTALVDYIMNEYSCHPPPNRTSDRVNRVLT